MPIPSQNEILVPFLEVLRDGQPHTRADILQSLAHHFSLTDSELQLKRGNQRVIRSRIGWCDAYFKKAGFITKDAHPQDSMLDVFRITIPGQNQLHRHAARIDVGYLQSFYQGNVYRGAGSSDTTSDAELDMFELFDALPHEFTVFHSISWIGETKRTGQSKTVGEIDFLVAHPAYGLLVIEVKGGEVFIQREGNQAQWYSRGFYGNVHNISDPCSQAERNRRELHDHLNKNRVTQRYQWAIFPAVALPESQVDDDLRPDCRAALFIDHRHLDDLAGRLIEIFEFWQHHADGANKHFSGQSAIEALLQDLVPTRQLSPRIGDMFERERRKIEQLTEEQFQLLRFIGQHHRAAIVGGAGTGKTMLAIEKAQQLANNDLRVLFLAFNRNIIQWIENTLPHDNITVTTYHSLVGTLQTRSGFNRNRNMDWDEFTERSPDMLLEAAEWLRQAHPDELFDAVIIDEAQDFDDAMWIPVPDLLKDPENGILYVFFDDNQRIYTQIGNVPIDTPPYALTQNCRNTQRIHATLMPYAVTDTQTTCNGPEGRDIEIIPVSSNKQAKNKLQRLLHRLVNEENIPHDEIVLLTPRSDRTSMWQDDEILGNFILTWDMQSEMNMAIKVCSIYSFKGLESSVIILSELDKLHDEKARQLVYVGLSRARNHAVILGELPAPDALIIDSETED